MTNKDIKKALATCAGVDCDDCPYYVFHTCYDKLKLDARDLIIKQEKKSNSSKLSVLYLTTNCAMRDKKQSTS